MAYNINVDSRQNIIDGIRAKASAIAGTTVALASIPASLTVQGDVPRVLVWTFGAMAGSVGMVAGKTAKEKELIDNDIRDVSDQARVDNLYDVMKPQRKLEPTVVDVKEMKLESDLDLSMFDWDSFRNERDKYPHISIEGKTGDGKSFLAESLSDVINDGIAIVVDTHWEHGHFPSLKMVIGAERNFGTSAEPYEVREPKKKEGEPIIIGEPEIDVDHIISGERVPTVCQFIRSLHNEMQERFELVAVDQRYPEKKFYRWKVEKRPIITVILDELNSYAKLPGVMQCLKDILREGRKAGIRLVFLVQSAQVKQLGIEGESDLREQLSRIRLGMFAKKHAKSLAKQHDDQRIVEIVHGMKRPCMVEDRPALVPTR
ncbi:hypothetical protein BLD44_028590 [Mastigocladus laminosus UU774]|nr:hypothetical protein BLD44_028590 [Mastigocladus laminosus UU774]